MFVIITKYVTFAMKRIFKIREVISILEVNGWYLASQNGTSHRQYKHPAIRKTVTVDGKLSCDMELINLKSIEKQTGIRFRDYSKDK